MATTIDRVRVTTGTRRTRRSALRLADEAARGCLADAGVRPDEVGLLVNTGLYRDGNLGEPALASLIQEDVGINPDDPHPGGPGTFSFDLANGSCGVLNALQVVDGFLRAGTVRRALIVASDADPRHHLAPAFPFAPAGAALLCSTGPEGVGLDCFRWVTDPDNGALFRSIVQPEDRRNLLRFHVSDEFSDRVAVLAAKVASQVLADAELNSDDVSVAVVAPSGPRFASAFAAAAGLDPERIVSAPRQGLHTVAFPAALDTALAWGLVGEGDTALFVCAGAGLTAGACLARG